LREDIDLYNSFRNSELPSIHKKYHNLDGIDGKDGVDHEIDSQKVEELVDINHGGFLVKGEKTGFHFEPDENGQYTIQLKVIKPNWFLELANFVLY